MYLDIVRQELLYYLVVLFRALIIPYSLLFLVKKKIPCHRHCYPLRLRPSCSSLNRIYPTVSLTGSSHTSLLPWTIVKVSSWKWLKLKLKPVSYTHLDVYKRQGYDNENECNYENNHNRITIIGCNYLKDIRQ